MLRQIRSAAFAVYLPVIVVLMGIGCMPVMLFGENAARATVKTWSRLALFGLKWIAGVSCRIEGAENIPQEGALIAANHQSMWETIALYALAPKPVMILKKELTRIPVYGWWARAAGNVTIDRKGGAKALRAMARAAKAHTDAGCQVVIFPEGTRSAPGARQRYQPGVAGIYTTAEAPCVPAAHDSGRFWRHPGGEKIPGVITLRFLPAIPPGLDRKTFLRELQSRIESARPDLVEANLTAPQGNANG
ncbi:lysophospholipid acyltransferase family protein [Hyphococcus luteus]|uniref:1-acyl-sn-glycerol-3-phosphate acyltransferase n=1 Tax=Hyphococcus luteus TaxID=2058213 RepID=A0A2S7K611_9PROT|nr:lysophospholipid acyltransferase family protein [Marinicaulis flavus]PQA87954.1 1-acyl-sn-glycerol-3-phosphate acyltransferase [Marinicaulis flavus]